MLKYHLFLSVLFISVGMTVILGSPEAQADSPITQSPVAASPSSLSMGGIQTLEQALGQAYLNNPDLDAARANLRVTDETVAQAVSGWRPQITGQLNQVGDKQRRGSDPQVTQNSSGANVSLSQSIFAGGGTYAATKKAENDVLAGRQGLLDVEQQTLLAAAQAYLTVLTQEKLVALLTESRAVLEKTLLETQARYEVGDVTKTDIAAAEAKVAQSIGRLVAAQGALETARANFAKIIGRPAGKLVFPKILLALPKTQAEAIKRALKNNPGLESFVFKQKSSEYNVDAQIAPLLPQVDLSAQASRTIIRNNGAIKDLTARVTVTVPIYDRGLNRSQIRQAEQQVAVTKLSMESARLSLIESTTQAWASHTAAQQSVVQYELQVAANLLALTGVREEFSLGMKSLLDVLKIEDDWRESSISLIAAQQNLIVSGYQLLSSTGQLTVAALKLDVPRYDPDKYYNEYSGAAFSFGTKEDLESFPAGVKAPPPQPLLDNLPNNQKEQG